MDLREDPVTQASHEYMYATDPAYKERHDWWEQKDKPVESVRGPVEGLAMAIVIPARIPQKALIGLRTLGAWTAYETANDSWSK